MKRKLTLLSGVIVVLALMVTGTLAYYTTTEKTTNVITTGNVDLIIHEKTANGENVLNTDIEIMPGDVVSRIVTMENTGNHPLYLRVKLTKNVDDNSLTAEECLDMDINSTEWTYKDGFYHYNTALQAGESTVPLFTEIVIDGKAVNNQYLGKVFDLNIIAYAVQSEHNGETVWDASFWPAE